MRRIGNWLVLLVLLIASAASSLPGEKTGSQVHQKPEDKYPSSLTREIHHQLLVLPFYSVFDFITFTLEDKKVTLSGQVVRHTLRDHAEATVKNIEGVDTVVNNIEVLPALPGDDELRRAVYRAIYEDPSLARYAIPPIPSIHIIAKNAKVSLEGFVISESDKNLAALRAGAVPNVLGLRNNLVVQPKGGTAE